jgi:hypothetical protein
VPCGDFSTREPSRNADDQGWLDLSFGIIFAKKAHTVSIWGFGVRSGSAGTGQMLPVRMRTGDGNEIYGIDL